MIARKNRICRWDSCNVDITNLPPHQLYCRKHSREMELRRKRNWAKNRFGLHKTLGGRILLDKHGMMRESVNARASKRYSHLWKELEKLKIYDLPTLTTITKQKLKNEKNQDEIKKLRTEITIINDALKKKIQQNKDNKIDSVIIERMRQRSVATSHLAEKLSELIPESVEGMSEQKKELYKKNLSDMTARELEVESESVEKEIKQVLKYHNTKKLIEAIERDVERRIAQGELTREEWEKGLQRELTPKEITDLEKRIPFIFLNEEFL